MTDLSPRLSLPYLLPSQAQKHVTHNEALQLLDALVQLSVAGFDATIPPGQPAEGDIHALGAAPTGDWAGQGGKLAIRGENAWQFVSPQEGWRAWGVQEQELRVYSGGDWVPQLQNVGGVGIGTVSDATNRLSVASDASLFNHDGSDHRMKINKAATGDTASLLFQSGWAGHAEMGLAGNDDWSIKVSADGANWIEALTFDGATGLPGGAAVQSGTSDATAGRLMTVGAFGLGALGGDAPWLSDLDAFDTAAGLYAIQTSTLGTRPNGAPDYGFCQVMRQAQTGIFQFYISSTGLTVAVRTATAEVWGEWSGLYGTHNLLGAVSQSGGVPTGAVIERGSNANGEYVRFADGTQICSGQVSVADVTTAAGSGFKLAANVQWTYPASFASGTGEKVAVSASANSGGIWAHVYVDSSVTRALVQAKSFGSTAGTFVVNLMAIGRWY